MSQITFTTTNEYIIVKIPKNSPEGKRLLGKKTLTEDQALKVFSKAKKDYRDGKLKEVSDLELFLNL